MKTMKILKERTYEDFESNVCDALTENWSMILETTNFKRKVPKKRGPKPLLKSGETARHREIIRAKKKSRR